MALSLFQLCVVFTVGSLVGPGPAQVWAGGGEGPGPPHFRGGGARAVLKGTPLQLPCSAPDPRTAVRSKPKHSNMLDIGSQHGMSIDKNVPEEDDYHYRDDDGFAQPADLEHSSDFELSDEDANNDELPRWRSNDGYRKKPWGKESNNRKLQRKQLNGGRRHKLRPKPEIKDDEDYEDGGEVKVSPVTYVWYHNGTEIKGNESRRYVSPNGTLFFKKFGSRKLHKGNEQDTGEYRCMAHGSAGATLSTIINLSFAFMDRNFTRYPVDISVYQGDAVQFSCDIKSSPPAKISWMKGSSTILPNKRILILATSSLLIKNVSFDDVGEYRCDAKNTIMNKTYSSSVGVISVKKQTQPFPISFVRDEFENSNETQLKHFKNVTAYYGEDVFLSCVVNGNPKPKVVWSYEADFSNVEIKEISSMEIHRIPTITEDSSGTYTCVASNVHQSIKQIYHVNVLRAPYLLQSPASEHTPTARTVRFNCSAGGSPPPTIVWYRDGRPLNITGRVKLKSQENKSPELIISDTVSADKGIYQCIAWSSVGEVSGWAPLTVQTQNVPPPYNVKCKPVGPDAVRITWLEESPKESVVAYTVHYVLADGGEEHCQILTATNYDLKKLELYRKYDIYMKAYNTHGASDQSEHIMCHGQGVRIYLSSMENNSIHVAWKDQSDIVKSWMVQWRASDQSNTVIHNVTLNGNANTYAVPDAFPFDKYEYRVLASPTEDWIDQDLDLIPWTSSKNRSIIPYKESFALKNRSHLDEFDASSPRIQEPEITDWTGQDSLRPTNVKPDSLGPHIINVSWSCDAAEASSDAYSFEVCYSPSSYTMSEMKMINKLQKRNETCQPSFNTWMIIKGLQPATVYSIRVQALMQNKPIRGPYSETVICRTKTDGKSSISDVRWKKIAENVVQISWTHIIDTNLSDDGTNDNFIELSEDKNADHFSSWTYTIRYSQDTSSPPEQWPSRNVTDDTSIELKNLDPEKGCFVMIFVAGEYKGTPLNITAKDMKSAPIISTSESLDQQLGIVLGLLVILLCLLAVGVYVTWHRRKRRRERDGHLSVQMRSRAGKSDFECQELMSQPPYVDSKGGVVYINGLESEGTMSSDVGEPLLNGHIRITENPRFLGIKHLGNGNCKPLLGKKSLGPVLDGTFDVSRYEELPDITIETTLETDISDQVSSEATSHSTLPMGRKQWPTDINGAEDSDCNGGATSNAVVEIVDNFNSQLTNVNNFKESVGNNITVSDKSYLNKKIGAKSFLDNDKQDKCGERIVADKSGLNFKNKCRVDALGDYKENGGSRRIAPVIGPNG